MTTDVPDDPRTRFGRALRAWREAHGLKQTDLRDYRGDKTGPSGGTVSKLEQGDPTVDLSSIRKAIAATGWTLRTYRPLVWTEGPDHAPSPEPPQRDSPAAQGKKDHIFAVTYRLPGDAPEHVALAVHAVVQREAQESAARALERFWPGTQ